MAAGPPQHPPGREIIDLDGDTGSPTALLEWQPSGDHIDLSIFERGLPSPTRQDIAAEAYQHCLKAVVAVFPDISHDHVQQLWDKSAWGALIGSDVLHHTLIEKILDGGPYPKEKDRLRELKKRKRASPEVEAAKWKYTDLRHDPEEYAKVAKARLSERFHWVPTKFITEAFKEHSHFYGAFFAIDEADRKRDNSIGLPFQRLKSKRCSNIKSEEIMASLEAQGYDFEGLREEVRTAEARWQKEEDNRRVAKELSKAKEALDEGYRRRGETMECACCFSDDNPPTDMTCCDADVPHFFCFSCAKQNADTDMTSLKYSLRCMDQSRCEATFSRQERARFLDASAIDKLERLQQQDEIRRADMGDLAACPFCEYAAICPPPDIDRVFECQNPECMEASCRLCKEKCHIPLSCEEFKKENGIGERHAIEEARTEALIRSCKKCKVRILKEDGCNKVICTNCYSVICDYCGEDITKVKYEHFDASTKVSSAKGKCPLYDQSNRKEDQIEKAGKDAMDKVRRENPGLSEDDLKIKFAKVVQDQSKRRSEMPDARFHPLGDIGLERPGRPLVRHGQADMHALRHAHFLERAQRIAQRPEANGDNLNVGLDEAGPQNDQRRYNDYHLMDLEFRNQALYPMYGRVVDGARNQPPHLPKLGHPFDPLPAGGGMDLIDWGPQLIPRNLQAGEIGFEPPIAFNDGIQPLPRAGRPQRDTRNPVGLEDIGGSSHMNPYQLREQQLREQQLRQQKLARLDQLGRTPRRGAHDRNQEEGLHEDPTNQPHIDPQPGSQLDPHGLNFRNLEDNNWMLIAGRAQPPTPKLAQHMPRAQDLKNIGLAGLGRQRRSVSPGVRAKPRDANVIVPPIPDQQTGSLPPTLTGHAMNAPIDLEGAPIDWPDMPDWDLGLELPEVMNDQNFELFLAGFSEAGQEGQQIQNDQRYL